MGEVLAGEYGEDKDCDGVKFDTHINICFHFYERIFVEIKTFEQLMSSECFGMRSFLKNPVSLGRTSRPGQLFLFTQGFYLSHSDGRFDPHLPVLATAAEVVGLFDGLTTEEEATFVGLIVRALS
jgi:hypothetical protein